MKLSALVAIIPLASALPGSPIPDAQDFYKQLFSGPPDDDCGRAENRCNGACPDKFWPIWPRPCLVQCHEDAMKCRENSSVEDPAVEDPAVEARDVEASAAEADCDKVLENCLAYYSDPPFLRQFFGQRCYALANNCRAKHSVEDPAVEGRAVNSSEDKVGCDECESRYDTCNSFCSENSFSNFVCQEACAGDRFHCEKICQEAPESTEAPLEARNNADVVHDCYAYLADCKHDKNKRFDECIATLQQCLWDTAEWKRSVEEPEKRWLGWFGKNGNSSVIVPDGNWRWERSVEELEKRTFQSEWDSFYPNHGNYGPDMGFYGWKRNIGGFSIPGISPGWDTHFWGKRNIGGFSIPGISPGWDTHFWGKRNIGGFSIPGISPGWDTHFWGKRGDLWEQAAGIPTGEKSYPVDGNNTPWWWSIPGVVPGWGSGFIGRRDAGEEPEKRDFNFLGKREPLWWSIPGVVPGWDNHFWGRDVGEEPSSI